MFQSASKGSEDNMGDEDYGNEDSSPPNASASDVRPRVDVAPLITDALIQEMNDKNWKVNYYLSNIVCYNTLTWQLKNWFCKLRKLKKNTYIYALSDGDSAIASAPHFPSDHEGLATLLEINA